LHILNNKHDHGTVEESLEPLKPCYKGTLMNRWETLYMQILHQNNMLINEQQDNDTNPFYELADTTRTPLHIS